MCCHTRANDPKDDHQEENHGRDSATNQLHIQQRLGLADSMLYLLASLYGCLILSPRSVYPDAIPPEVIGNVVYYKA